jgi:hypothetical protein
MQYTAHMPGTGAVQWWQPRDTTRQRKSMRGQQILLDNACLCGLRGGQLAEPHPRMEAWILSHPMVVQAAHVDLESSRGRGGCERGGHQAAQLPSYCPVASGSPVLWPLMRHVGEMGFSWATIHDVGSSLHFLNGPSVHMGCHSTRSHSVPGHGMGCCLRRLLCCCPHLTRPHLSVSHLTGRCCPSHPTGLACGH